MSICRPLSGDGAGGSGDKNIGERDARQGPAQRALQSVQVMMDCHVYFFQFSEPAGEEREGGDLPPNPERFSGLSIRCALWMRLWESGCHAPAISSRAALVSRWDLSQG